MTTVDLKAAIQQLDALPAMPVIAQKILALQLDTAQGEAELLRLIGQDPQIAARIIGLANSALFGASRRVASISDAAILLGLTRVKSVAVGIAVISAIGKRPTGNFKIESVWQHSLAMAAAMRVLSRAMPARLRPLEDEIFLTGLLHDIGYLALSHLDPLRSDLLQARMAAEPDKTIDQIEVEVIDISHGELGEALARHWDLPERISKAIRYHHTPNDPHAAEGQPLVALAHLGEKMLSAFCLPERVDTVITDAEWEALGIDPDKAEALREAVAEQAEQAKQAASAFAS